MLTSRQREAEGVGLAPAAQLKVATDHALQILSDPTLKSEAKRGERRQAIRRVAEDAFDFEEMAKRTLGPHWQSLSQSQRTEFIPLFEDLLQSAYIAIFERYSGEPIKYTGERVEGELAVISTRIITTQGQGVPVDYRMLARGGRWLIYDVQVEGMSLVANYGSQFNSILRTADYNELVKRMQARITELETPR